MHPRLVERLTLPLLHRRTWPLVRASLREIRAAERLDPAAVEMKNVATAIRVARAAAERSPFLRRLYAETGVDPSRMETAADFRRLPVMTKQMLRDHTEEIVSEGADRDDLVRSATGGSTGVPTPYYHDTVWWCRATAAAFRGDEWTGWRIGQRQATVWGTPLGESRRARTVRRMSERARNFLFLPGFDLSPSSADTHLERLARFRPILVSGYASILSALARRALDRGGFRAPPRAIVSSAEPLSPEDRALIESGFRAPVFDRFGSREIGFIAQECSEHSGLHVATEHVRVEIDVDGRAAKPGETGRVLVTLLDNASFPLVRYDVGDLATAGDTRPCRCGLSTPRLARVDGRQLDVIWTSSGGALTGVYFPHLMKEHRWVAAFQVVQDERGAIQLRVVPDPSVPRGDGPVILVRAVKHAVGEREVRLRFVDALEHTPSGKVRVTRSDFRPETGHGVPVGSRR